MEFRRVLFRSYDALNTLTQFTGSIQNELTQNGFTPNASFLNLRGLGPGYQLILINGRRAADYPLPYNSQSNAVNLNAIRSKEHTSELQSLMRTSYALVFLQHKVDLPREVIQHLTDKGKETGGANA